MIKMKITIQKEIWSNEDGSFIVYSGFSYKENGEIFDITVNTSGFELRPGKTTLVGQMREYRGKPSFKADYEEFDSSSYDSKYNLLCSIDGIKSKTAKKILDGIPNNDIEIFYNKDVPKIKGIGDKTIKKIHEGLNFLRENKNLKELFSLIGNNIGTKRIHELNKYLIEKKIDIKTFKADPYYILIDKIGMSFKKVDYLAQNKFNCDKYLRSRIVFLTEQIVKAITGFGHTYTDLDNFNKKVLDLNLEPENINILIDSADSKVINDNGRIQTKSIADAEKEIPLALQGFKDNQFATNYERGNIEILIRQYEKENNIVLHEKQKEAVFESIVQNTSIICGGAGTGKTSVLKCIIFVLEKLNNYVLLTSPTGKASRRMSEATEHKAYTCHRFYFAEDASIISKNDLDWHTNKPTTMIIDEFSMVDTKLFHHVLVSMVISKTNFNRIILVGDHGQLPSVGSGQVMADIINSKQLKVIELTNTFRQQEGSNILTIANKVRINESFKPIKEKDFFLNCPSDLNSYILRCFLYQKKLIPNLDMLFDEFQICTSSRKRANEINKMIQEEMKNTQFIINKKPIGFGIGDKIMCIKNDYLNDIYNGEFGRVSSLTYRKYSEEIKIEKSEELKKIYENKEILKDAKFQVYYSGLDKTISYDLDFDEISNFTLSYCCTIHKLQGSEFKTVLCDCSEFNMITDNKLLYTAITRAKGLFILITDKINTIDKIVNNKISSKRNTLLLERFQDINSQELDKVIPT